MSPWTKTASCGTAHQKPVERLSSTTTFSPRSSKLQHHMAADIACPSRNQYRHRRHILKIRNSEAVLRKKALTGSQTRSAIGINWPDWTGHQPVAISTHPAAGRPAEAPLGPSMTKRIRKAVFPVAGLGTRFLPATKAIPKEMLTIVDRPVVQHVVDEARAAGIEHFVFVTGRNKARDRGPFRHRLRARRHAGASAARPRSCDALRADLPAAGATSFTRQQAPLGLGHAVWCARDIIGDDEPFALLLPDMLHHTHGKGCLAEMIDAYERAWRQPYRGRAGARGPDPSIRHRRCRGRDGQGLQGHRDGREAG